jgi:hypothetical protein
VAGEAEAAVAPNAPAAAATAVTADIAPMRARRPHRQCPDWSDNEGSLRWVPRRYGFTPVLQGIVNANNVKVTPFHTRRYETVR